MLDKSANISFSNVHLQEHCCIISYLEREGSLWFFLRGLLGYRGRLGNTCRGLPRRSGGYRSGGTNFSRTVPPRRWWRGRFNLTLQPAQAPCLVKYLESAYTESNMSSITTPWSDFFTAKYTLHSSTKCQSQFKYLQILANGFFHYLYGLVILLKKYNRTFVISNLFQLK